MNKIWTEREKEFIRQNANRLKDKEIAAELTKTSGRRVSLDAVRKQRQKLGIAKKPGRGICNVTQKEGSSIGIGIAPATRHSSSDGPTVQSGL